MSAQKKQVTLVNILYFAAVLGIVILICRKGLPVLMPFLIALLVSLILRPAVRFLTEKAHLGKGFSSFFVTLLFYAVVTFLVILLGAKILSGIRSVISGLPTYYRDSIKPALNHLGSNITDLVDELDPESANTVNIYLSSIGSAIETGISSLSVSAIKWLSSIVIALPSTLVSIIITIIATVFIVMDYPILKEFVATQLKPKTRVMTKEVIDRLRSTIGKYLRSYGLIMCITFCELLVGFLIIGQKNAPILALLIAVMDILPIVGCGTVLIPWAIIATINANYRQAVSIAVMYIIITVIRNYIEPKIVGKNVGLHPIITLMAMVIGNAVFGPIGILGLPIACAIIKSLNDAGLIHWFKYPETKETKDIQDPKSSEPVQTE